MIKFKKKSIVAITLAFSVILGMVGCGKTKDLTTEDKGVTVEATSGDATEEGSSSNTTVTESGTTEEVSTSKISEASTEESSTEITTEASSAEALPGTEEVQAAFDEYLDKEFKETVVNDTITLHYTLANPEAMGITPPAVTFGDIDLSEEGIAKDKAETEQDINELKTYNYDLLRDDQKFVYDILLDYLNTSMASYDNPYLYEPFAYTSGLQANYPITMAEYKFYDQGDIDDYLELLELTPDYFDACLSFEQVKSEKGLFMNSNSVGEVIRQCSDFIAKPEENLLLATFESRLEKVEGLTDKQKKDYIATNKKLVEEKIIPAYQKVVDTFTALKDTGKNELGLVHLEGGADYYKYLLASKVGTDKTPEEIIELLETSIKNTMDDLTKKAILHYDAYSKYVNDYGSLYKDMDYMETVEFFETACDDRFPDIPDIDFSISPVHESLKDSVSPAFFMTPPIDGYKSNYIYVNEASTDVNTLWSTLAHEGVPGHMYQFVYFLSGNPEPIRTLLNFTGYQEGWATYVEQLSYDYYSGYADPFYAELERMNNQLNLYVSARVEIGINYEGWTLEDTEKYMEQQGFDKTAAKSLMDYVVAEPANYQMYVVGALSFIELRDYAEKSLGDKFSEVEFHRAVLDAGPCQFPLLKQKVDEYIEASK